MKQQSCSVSSWRASLYFRSHCLFHQGKVSNNSWGKHSGQYHGFHRIRDNSKDVWYSAVGVLVQSVAQPTSAKCVPWWLALGMYTVWAEGSSLLPGGKPGSMLFLWDTEWQGQAFWRLPRVFHGQTSDPVSNRPGSTERMATSVMMSTTTPCLPGHGSGSGDGF